MPRPFVHGPAPHWQLTRLPMMDKGAYGWVYVQLAPVTNAVGQVFNVSSAVSGWPVDGKVLTTLGGQITIWSGNKVSMPTWQ